MSGPQLSSLDLDLAAMVAAGEIVLGEDGRYRITDIGRAAAGQRPTQKDGPDDQ